jgi:hypothetical protein
MQKEITTGVLSNSFPRQRINSRAPRAGALDDGIWLSIWAPERGEERRQPRVSRGSGEIKT